MTVANFGTVPAGYLMRGDHVIINTRNGPAVAKVSHIEETVADPQQLRIDFEWTNALGENASGWVTETKAATRVVGEDTQYRMLQVLHDNS